MRIDVTWDISLHRGFVTNQINDSEAKLELFRIAENLIGDVIIETDGLNRPNNVLVNLYTFNILLNIGAATLYTYYYDRTFIQITGYKFGRDYNLEIDQLIPNYEIVLYDDRDPIMVGVIKIGNYE